MNAGWRGVERRVHWRRRLVRRLCRVCVQLQMHVVFPFTRSLPTLRRKSKEEEEEE